MIKRKATLLEKAADRLRIDFQGLEYVKRRANSEDDGTLSVFKEGVVFRIVTEKEQDAYLMSATGSQYGSMRVETLGYDGIIRVFYASLTPDKYLMEEGDSTEVLFDDLEEATLEEWDAFVTKCKEMVKETGRCTKLVLDGF